MDIWRWVNDTQDELVESGRVRLAELIEVIPNYATDDRHTELDAAVPEALALAREAKNPWLELFIRHWNLQSRVLHRHEVAASLPEAVRLIELANRDETRECPQSVCVTQDLAACYAAIDGPAYVEERLAVAKETLDRIDARWPCFTCISCEYATALIDDERWGEALEFLDAQIAELARVGRAEAEHELSGPRIDALLSCDRAAEALALAERGLEDTRDEHQRGSLTLDRAVALAKLRRFDEALEARLPFERILPTHSLYERWTQVTLMLTLSRVLPDDWKLDAQFYTLARRLSACGVIRKSFEIEERRAWLAFLRGNADTVREVFASMRELLPRLRAPLGADKTLEGLERRLEELEKKPAPEEPPPSADEILARLGEDPEQDTHALARALQRFPDDERIALALAASLRARARSDAANALLERFVAEHPDARDCLLTLGKSLLTEGRSEAARALGESALTRARGREALAAAHWLIAASLRKEGRLVEARPALAAFAELMPGEIGPQILLASLDRDIGDLEAALARLDRLVAEHEAPGDHDWERMIVATLLDRWDTVRASARRIGMDVEPGSTPIDEAWSFCRIELTEPNGERSIHYAIRTGPVTARIIEVAHPTAPQHYGDEIVFDPTPRDAPPKPDAPAPHARLYSAIRSRREGGYRAFVVDGVHPGEAALEALRSALADRGCVLSVRSDDTYVLVDPANNAPLIGIFAFLAVPADFSLLELHRLLVEQTRGYAHPLIWPALATELELEEEIAQQAEIVDRYAL